MWRHSEERRKIVMKPKIGIIALTAMIFLLMSAGLSYGSSLAKLTDAEMDGVYAQGLTFLIDANTFLGSNNSFTNSVVNNYGATTLNLSGTNTFNLSNSIMLTGSAQQGAFMPVNAANSAVNVPVNIIVLINSNVIGGVNISNLLNAINHAP
jgi:hypothetical protein